MSTEFDLKKMFAELVHTDEAVKEAARVRLSKDLGKNKGEGKVAGVEVHQYIPASRSRETGKTKPERLELVFKTAFPNGSIYSEILGTFPRPFAENLLKVDIVELVEKIFEMKKGMWGRKSGLVWTALTFEKGKDGRTHIK